MTEHDDFDIVPDEENSRFSRSGWMWMAVIAIVAIFAFAVGAAYIVVSQRFNSAPIAPTPTPANQAVITGTVPLTQTTAITVTGTPTATLTPTATATFTPTLTPTPTALVCTDPVEEVFRPLYDQDAFGCPVFVATNVWAAWQPFERGAMLWRSDTDRSYVFYDNGEWGPIDITWSGQDPAGRGTPPPGLQAPERGFGYVWSNSDEIFNRLGWATDQERGFCALTQQFDRGFILRSSDVPSCTAEGLYNHATSADWQPLLLAAPENSVWYNVPPPDLDASVGGERPAGTMTRPANQGIFVAPQLTGITLDANLTDWPDDWQPMNALVFGLDNHSGPGDLSANYQLAWNRNGLLLAVRVNDDIYSPGPEGTNQWQGDGFEIQFDADLAGDFNRSTADDDDTQIGVAFSTDLNGLRGYQWLPFSRETALTIPGSVLATERGYQAEFIIPWYIFGLDPESVSTSTAYGFNFTVNDNDSSTPAQQTVLSASAMRTTHDNPTEWGTLILLP